MVKGRRANSNALAIVRGTGRKDRQVGEEPVPPPGPVERPAWLRKHAAAAWDEMAPAAIEMGVLTPADVQAFALLCAALAEYRQLYAYIQHNGRSYKAKTEHGFIMRARPQVAMRDAAWRQTQSMAVEFGLTASSRARVKKPKETGRDDPLKKLMARKVT